MTKENNGWISVEDRLPDMYPCDYYGELSNDILLYGIDDSGSEPHIFIGFMIEGNAFYSNEYGFRRLRTTRLRPNQRPKR